MSSNICKILGDNVKKYRKTNGYSQEKFAEMIEIGVTSLSLIERGKGFATSATLEKISSVLNVPIYVLMCGESIENKEVLLSEIHNKLELIKNDDKKLKLLNEYLKILI